MVGLWAQILTGRYFGSITLGIVVQALAIFTLIGVSTAGLQASVAVETALRDVSKDAARETGNLNGEMRWRRLVALTVTATVIVGLCAHAILQFLSPVSVASALYVPLAVTAAMLLGSLQGKGRVIAMALVALGLSLAKLVSVFVAYLANFPGTWLPATFVLLSALVVFGYGSRHLHRDHKQLPTSTDFLKRTLLLGATWFCVAAPALFSQWSELSDTQVGNFLTSWAIATAPLILTVSISNTVVSRSLRVGGNKVHFLQDLSIIILIATVSATVTTVLSGPIVEVYLGYANEDAINFLKIVAWVAIPASIVQFLSQHMLVKPRIVSILLTFAGGTLMIIIGILALQGVTLLYWLSAGPVTVSAVIMLIASVGLMGSVPRSIGKEP